MSKKLTKTQKIKRKKLQKKRASQKKQFLKDLIFQKFTRKNLGSKFSSIDIFDDFDIEDIIANYQYIAEKQRNILFQKF